MDRQVDAAHRHCYGAQKSGSSRCVVDVLWNRRQAVLWRGQGVPAFLAPENHLDKTLRQNVLQEALHEGENRQGDSDAAVLLALLVPEGDCVIFQMECLHLCVKDVDFERHQITMRDTKGNEDRVTMLPQVVAYYCGIIWMLQYVFPSEKHSIDPCSKIVRRHQLDESGLQKAVQRAALDAGISKHVTPYMARYAKRTLQHNIVKQGGLCG